MLNRKSLYVVLPLICLVLMACNLSIPNIGRNRVRGSGKVSSEERPVSGFDRVSLSGIGQLEIVVGDEESLVIEAEDNLLQYITTEVRGRELGIGVQRGISLDPTEPIRYSLTVTDLSRVQVSGSGSVFMETLETEALELAVSGSGNLEFADLQVQELSVNASGSGNFDLAGTAAEQKITISGSSNYYAGDLESKVVELEVSGSGEALLWVTDDLRVRISGSGDVEYYGNPNVDRDISGSGNLRSLGDHD